MITGTLLKSEQHLQQLKSGNEKGLEHFYKTLYPRLVWWALKRVKDDVAASSITHEAFLKLWLLREKMSDTNQLRSFLDKHINQSCNEFYQKTTIRFHRNMMRLDDIEDYQEFIGGYMDDFDVEEIDTVYQQELDKEKKIQWEAVVRVLPNMSQEQQLFIKLCLQYSFSYDRISWHLGGISDYEIATRIEKAIESLKSVIINAKKLEVTTRNKSFLFEGGISDEQAQILNLRYEMEYSFEDIAAKLGLTQHQVKKTFVQAHAAIKRAAKKS